MCGDWVDLGKSLFFSQFYCETKTAIKIRYLKKNSIRQNTQFFGFFKLILQRLLNPTHYSNSPQIIKYSNNTKPNSHKKIHKVIKHNT